MKKTHKKITDFFSTYRSNLLHRYMLSGGIALFVAFSSVGLIHSDIDTRGLMASVANVATNAPHYEADLIMTQNSGELHFTFGAKAEKVEKIDFTLLSDPTRFHTLTSTNKDITIVSQQEMGAYHVSVDMHGQDILPGTTIASLVVGIDEGTPIAVSDTEFVSGGQRYSITNKGE